jgi:hypothetical protein
MIQCYQCRASVHLILGGDDGGVGQFASVEEVLPGRELVGFGDLVSFGETRAAHGIGLGDSDEVQFIGML